MSGNPFSEPDRWQVEGADYLADQQNYNRFSQLKKIIPNISKQMLVNQLRELEEDKVLERIIYAEIPPRVEYKLTEYGESLMPVIYTMQAWGLKEMEKQGE